MENRSVAVQVPLTYGDMAAAQRQRVAELEERAKAAPSEALTDELDRQTDKLRFYANAALGNPKLRAALAAAAAKKAALSKVVVQPMF
ncbi:MAG: hypothetical protein ACT4O9_01830 [Blastocatellia bacterium]